MSSRSSIRKIGTLPQASTATGEELSKFQADINTLTDRLASLQAQSSSSSSFVSNLKQETQRNANVTEGDKITMLENILAKIVEVDRHVLRKTQPETTEGATAGRRKSRGMDLYTLPTHLHIIDRLVDLHTQSKRVTVIKNIDPNAPLSSETPTTSSRTSTIGGENGGMSREMIQQLQSSIDKEKENGKKQANEISSLKTQLDDLKKERSGLLKELEDKKVDNESKLKDSDAKIEELQISLDETVATLNKTVATLNDTQHKLEEAIEMSNQDRKSNENDEAIQKLRAKISTCEEIIDVNETKYSNLISCIINFSNMIRDKTESSQKMSSLFDNLYEQAKVPVSTMGSTVMCRLDNMQQEVLQHMTQKDALENELNSSTLQRNLLSDDLTKLSADHDALKGAYQVMEFELATINSKKESEEKTQVNPIEVDDLKQKIEVLNTKIKDQNLEIAANTKKIFELEKGAELVIQLTAKVATVQEKNCELEAELKNSKETIEMYKTNCESLKQKIKQLGSGNNDFMDTFEEVMREEMQAMKTAFENKLRLAKEDNELSAQRHRQAIQNLMAMSPSVSRSNLFS